MIPIAQSLPRKRYTGTENIDLRFAPALENGVYVPSYVIGVWIHFTDLSDYAESLNKVCARIESFKTGTAWDQIIDTQVDIGIGARGTDDSAIHDYILVVPEVYAHQWLLEIDQDNPNAYDQLHITWTNDDPGNIRWGLSASILPASALGGILPATSVR